MSGDRRATHATATVNYIYITRSVGADDRGALDYRHRNDLVAQGLKLPLNHPRWAEEPGRIWRELDAAMTELSDDAIRAWPSLSRCPRASRQISRSLWYGATRRRRWLVMDLPLPGRSMPRQIGRVLLRTRICW